MTHKKEVWAVLIVVVVGAGMLVYAAAHAVGQVLALQSDNGIASVAGSGISGVDISTWQTYTDPTSGFSIKYPPNWRIFTNGLSGSTPFAAFGNPLTGTSTYVMDIFIEPNPQALSSGEYVHQLLSVDHAQDVASGAMNGLAPTITPQFASSYLATVNGSTGYELFSVFEFDHNAERIYVAHGALALHFDFPVSDANPDIASPANNNAIAHMIMNTLVW